MTTTFTVNFGAAAPLNQAALEQRLTALLNLGQVTVRILAPSTQVAAVRSSDTATADHTVTFTIVGLNADAQASALLALPPATVCAALNALSFSPVDTPRTAAPAPPGPVLSSTAIVVIAVLAVLVAMAAVIAVVVRHRRRAAAAAAAAAAPPRDILGRSERELSWRGDDERSSAGGVGSGQSQDLYAPLHNNKW